MHAVVRESKSTTMILTHRAKRRLRQLELTPEVLARVVERGKVVPETNRYTTSNSAGGARLLSARELQSKTVLIEHDGIVVRYVLTRQKDGASDAPKKLVIDVYKKITVTRRARRKMQQHELTAETLATVVQAGEVVDETDRVTTTRDGDGGERMLTAREIHSKSVLRQHEGVFVRYVPETRVIIDVYKKK